MASGHGPRPWPSATAQGHGLKPWPKAMAFGHGLWTMAMASGHGHKLFWRVHPRGNPISKNYLFFGRAHFSVF